MEYIAAAVLVGLGLLLVMTGATGGAPRLTALLTTKAAPGGPGAFSTPAPPAPAPTAALPKYGPPIGHGWPR
jgi:hypothetical protein